MLPNKDELVIRYVMQELDPSEKVIVEKAMGEDENLLIEVESLRSTYMRYASGLEKVNAPDSVLEHVLQSAEEIQMKAKSPAPVRYLVFRRISYAAAATVILSAGFSWYAATGSADSHTTTESLEFSLTPIDLQSPSNTPWVDNQNILHINSAGFGSVATAPDSIPVRLRPVEDVIGTSRPARQLQLTGSQ